MSEINSLVKCKTYYTEWFFLSNYNYVYVLLFLGNGKTAADTYI